MSDDERRAVAVIGVGNVFYGDDGFGIRVVEMLRGEGAPEGVDVIDGSGLGVGLIEYLTDYRRVILVDAAEMGLAAGELRVFRPEDVRSAEKGTPLSLHSTDILGVLQLAKTLAQTVAHVTIVAMQPAFVGQRAGLSDEAEGALSGAVTEVRNIAAGVAGG